MACCCCLSIFRSTFWRFLSCFISRLGKGAAGSFPNGKRSSMAAPKPAKSFRMRLLPPDLRFHSSERQGNTPCSAGGATRPCNRYPACGNWRMHPNHSVGQNSASPPEWVRAPRAWLRASSSLVSERLLFDQSHTIHGRPVSRLPCRASRQGISLFAYGSAVRERANRWGPAGFVTLDHELITEHGSAFENRVRWKLDDAFGAKVRPRD